MIVAAIGQSEQSSNVVSEAKILAEDLDEQLHVVHVLSPMEAKSVSQDTASKTASETESKTGQEIATEIAADAAVGVEDVTATGLIGKASEEIIEYARKHDARYIVIGSQKRTPTGKAVFGSVTQAVLLNADRPVLTVLSQESFSK